MVQRPRDLDPENSMKDFFGAELRHWRIQRGLSQSQLAAIVHFTAEMISKVEKAQRWASAELTDACDAALDTGGALGRFWPLAEAERLRQINRRDGRSLATNSRYASSLAALELVGAPAHTGSRDVADPPTAGAGYAGGAPRVESEIFMAAYQSAYFGDHPSNVGPLTLDQLRAETSHLARSFPTAPRLAIFGHARWLRDRLFGLLDGRQRVAETRDLYFLSGAVCGMLAQINDDFGHADAGMAHARTALLCADEAGHDGLKAWIRSTQSQLAYNDGRPRHAAEYARSAQEYATTGPIAARLPACEARATAALRDREGTAAALDRALAARDRVAVDDLDDLGGVLSFSLPKQHFYAAEAHMWLEDAATVVTEAGECIAGYQSGPPADRAYPNEAQSQVNLAIAHVLDRDLDAAREAAQPALGLGPDIRVACVDDRLRDLHHRLTTADIRTNADAVSLRDQIEDFLTTAAPTLPNT